MKQICAKLADLGAYAAEGICSSYMAGPKSTDDYVYARTRLWGYQAAMRDLVTFEIFGEPTEKARQLSATIDTALDWLEANK